TLGEIHAFIERAQITSVPFYDISNTANRLNELLYFGRLDINWEDKQALTQRLLAVLDSRQAEAGADDFSRMAWLAMRLDQKSRAREYALAALALEADHYHSGKILERLNRG